MINETNNNMLTETKKKAIKESVEKATKFFINANLAAGKTAEEIDALYRNKKVRSEILETAKRLQN